MQTLKTMKIITFISALLFLLMSYQNIYCQLTNDFQWLILDGKGKQGVDLGNLSNNYVQLSDRTSLSIDGLAYPRVSPPPNPSLDGDYDNRFFVIFDNLDYSLGSMLSQEATTIPNPNIGNRYRISSSNPVLYMYLSNIYEEDDPPRRVFVNSPVTTNGDVDNLNPQTFSSRRLRINHNPVDRRDLTIIIENDDNDTCSLEYNIQGGNLDFKLIPSGFTHNSNILPLGNNVMFTNGVSDSFNVGNGNTFLNYLVSFDNDELVDKQFMMTLNCVDRVPLVLERKTDLSNRISSNFHDPNSVELMCVWEEIKFFRRKRYAKYKISCFNEGSGDVNSLAMSFTLPKYAIPNTVVYDNESIRNIGRCVKKKDESKSYNKQYTFIGGLGPYNSGLENASIIFCVELRRDTDLKHADLSLTNPMTHFQNYPYAIATFIDQRVCSPTRVGNYCHRPIGNKKCRCKCKKSHEPSKPASN